MAKRQSRGRFVAGAVFAVVLGIAVYEGDKLLGAAMSENEELPVRAVQIDGVLTHLSKKQIADLAGQMAAGLNIATLDTSILRDELMKEPWIAQAVVRKKMPDTLVISVVEHVPAAFWNDNGLYDAKTRSVFYPDLKTVNLPLVRLGAFRDNLAPEVYDSAVLFIREMNNSKLQMVELFLDKVRCYTMTLSNGTRLILGRGEKQCVQRLRRFLESFAATGLKIDEVSYVDLRYDVGFAVGKRQQEEKNSGDTGDVIQEQKPKSAPGAKKRR